MEKNITLTIIEGKNCPVCYLPVKAASIAPNIPDSVEIFCYRCGLYTISEDAAEILPKDRLVREAISAHIRHNPGVFIKSSDVTQFSNLPILNAPEKADLLLLELSKKYPTPGTTIENIWGVYRSILNSVQQGTFNMHLMQAGSNFKIVLDSLAVCQISDLKELKYITNTFLVRKKQFLDVQGNSQWIITPDGWDHIYSLMSANLESQAGFIAMRFTDDLKKFCDDYIGKGIIDAGYQPLRVDKDLSADLIDDTIVASIRRSKFIVADLTENSFGVYYEAGFARGLGLPVIYTCNEDYFKKKGVHFDVNHYPVLKWTYDKGPDIQKGVQMRIEANVGRGTYNPEIRKANGEL